MTDLWTLDLTLEDCRHDNRGSPKNTVCVWACVLCVCVWEGNYTRVHWYTDYPLYQVSRSINCNDTVHAWLHFLRIAWETAYMRMLTLCLCVPSNQLLIMHTQDCNPNLIYSIPDKYMYIQTCRYYRMSLIMELKRWNHKKVTPHKGLKCNHCWGCH